jgi:DNA-binding LytR/AlgR family response regulator
MTGQLDEDHSYRTQPLNGLRLLVVEDQFFVAMEVTDLISSLGAEVIGPYSLLNQALDAVQRQAIDGGVLDVKLDSEKSYPIADVLMDSGRPVLLVTGGDPEGIPEKYRALPCLLKPFDRIRFQKMAGEVFRRHNPMQGNG